MALLRSAARSFRPVFLVPVLLAVALGAWAFASPVGSSPDDDFHLSSIWCANPLNTSSCVPGDDPGSKYVPDLIKNAHLCFQAQPNVSADCQEDTLDFSPTPTELTTRGSFLNSYPPIYYFTMSLFVGPNIVVSVLLMRFVNILLFAGITTALFALLPVRIRVTLAWSWLISIVPLSAFLIGSNNPSSWAIIGVGTAWAALYGFFESEGRRRVALGALFAVGVVMAAGSRADAAIYSVIGIGGVLLLTFARSRGFLLKAILPAAMAVVALVLYLTSGQASVATSGLGSVQDLPDDRGLQTLVGFNVLHVTDLFVGVFGSWGLGWLDVILPPIVTFGAAVTFVGVVFTGLGSATWRKVVVVSGTAAVLVVLPIYVLIRGGNVVGEVLQPRYLLPLIILFAGFALITRRGEVLRLGAVQITFVGAALTVANAVALHVNLQRYVSGADNGGLNLDDTEQWWWSGFVVSPNTTWLIGSVAFGVAVVLLLRELARLAALPTHVGEAPAALASLD